MLAVTVKVDVPVAVGVPERIPALLSASPAGRVPEDTANVAAGTPEAVNAYEYAAPTVPMAGGVLAVNTGAAGVWITDTVLLPKFATYATAPSGLNATAKGVLPTVMVLVTALLATSITDTVLLPEFPT